MRISLFILLFFFSLNSISQKDSIIFSHESGIYSSPLYLKLSNNSGDKIFYSLDGSYPKTEFKKSILLSKSTTVRVKHEKILQGETRNYIFPGRKITLPIVCLTINPPDLYDVNTGIYVKGLNAKKDPPYFGANFHKGWEKMAYIELINKKGKVEFNQKVGVKIFGQFSAMLPQKSFAVYARSKYGKKKIKSKIFLDQPYNKYKSIILRNSGSDFGSTQFRDAMMTSLVNGFNIEVQDYRSCVVYLNGKYWGIYHIREKINEHFIKQHSGIDKDSVAILKHKGSTQHNRRMNYKKMLKFINKTNFSHNENIDSLGKLMDIDNYLDYNIAQVYFNNIDAGGNIRFWRPIKKGGKWRWILFDTDFGFGLKATQSEDKNTIKDYLTKSKRKWPYPDWSTLIIRKLMENDSLKEVYLRKFNKHLNYTLSEKNVTRHIGTFVDNLRPEIDYHFKKWNRSENIWDTQVNKLLKFAKKRPDYLFGYLCDYFEKDSVYKIEVGNISNGTLSINNTQVDSGFTGSFFSQLPYLIEAKPSFGFHFEKWNHDKSIKENKFEIEFNKDLHIIPEFVINEESKYMGALYINEVGKRDSLFSDYIEIYNSSDESINVSGWILINENDNRYTFPFQKEIAPKSYLSVFKNQTLSNTKLSNSLFGLFNIASNSKLRLYTNNEELVESLELKKSYFKSGEISSRINTVLKKGWIACDSNSINSKNPIQEEYEKQNNNIIIGFLILLGLLFLSILIFLIRKKWPRGATE